MQLVRVAVPSLNRPPPLTPAVLPLTVQSVRVGWPPLLIRPPPPSLAELPLTVQSVRVAVPAWLYRPAPLPSSAELPLTVHSARGSAKVIQAAAEGRRVAADGAIAQGQRAQVVQAAAAAALAGVAVGDRQPRDRRADIRIDQEHPAGIVAAHRQQVRAPGP